MPLPFYTNELMQVIDKPGAIAGRARPPTPSAANLIKAAGYRAFPITFILSDDILTLLQRSLTTLNDRIPLTFGAHDTFTATLNNAILMSVIPTAAPETPKELTAHHRAAYFDHINRLLPSNVASGVLRGVDEGRTRRWIEGGLKGINGPWLLCRGEARARQPLAFVWEQTTKAISNDKFDLIHRAISHRIITLRSSGDVVVNPLRAYLVGSEIEGEAVGGIMSHMWMRMALNRVRIGVMTTHERTMVFYVKNSKIEVSRVFVRGSGGEDNVFGGLMALLTALSFLNPDDYLFDPTGAPRLIT
ncbi:hypothetical protein M231_05506 [Tremella mesenterica]|uniref:Uncharacterized protein n=1 Tax=Tremella mesenterica TaxID=5217 RepID=A0A4Q1BI11_TREME|nr:hypothetical protein M231_05506 [Tremella mesenterica]